MMSYFAVAVGSYEKEGMKTRRPLVLMVTSSTATAVSAGQGRANPLAELTDRFRSLETGVQVWMVKQPMHIEATVTAVFGVVQCGELGGLMARYRRKKATLGSLCRMRHPASTPWPWPPSIKHRSTSPHM
jgi:hypothetical protein